MSRKKSSRRQTRRSPSAPVEPMERRVLLDAIPSADIRVDDVLAGGGSALVVTVTYTDDKAVAVTSVGSSDVTVVNEAGGAALVLQTVAVNPQVSTTPLVATYTFTPPGGKWDGADNGRYRVNVESNRVFDREGNAVKPESTTFKVEVPGGAPVGDGGGDDGTGDGVAPVAILQTIPDVAAGGATAATFTVVYTDDVAVNPQSIGTNDLVVASPTGGTMTVTGVTTDVTDGGRRVVATYTATPPGGAWDAADNGTYTATVRFHSVLDASGLPVEGAAQQFKVAVPTTVPPPADAPPTAALGAVQDVTEAGGAGVSVVVTYQDDVGVNAQTVDAADVAVSGPGGALASTGVTTNVTDGGRTVTATYAFAAPDGSWDAADAGAYQITLAPGAVADNAGQTTTGAAGGFDVSIAAVPPTVPPTVP
ncbi:MAG TPA: hypothetical protein VF796_19855, partial [Humisphaera sp.]